MAQEQFYQFLRRKRRKLGMSQEDLASDAAVSSNYLAKLETGIREPGLKVLIRLANSLQIPKEEILSIVTQSWPEVSNIDAKVEFSEFPSKIQELLVEIGYLIQKNGVHPNPKS